MLSRSLMVTMLAATAAATPTTAAEVGDPTPHANCRFIPAAARTLDLTGTFWTTDLELLHTGATAADVTVALLTRGEDNSEADVLHLEEPLLPGDERQLADVVPQVMGAQWRDWVGGLAVCASEPGVEAYAHVRLVREEAGAVGLGIPAVSSAEGLSPGETGFLFGLRDDDDVRSNVGVLNLSPHPVRVSMVVEAEEEGDVSQIWVSVELRPYTQFQITRFLDYLSERARREFDRGTVQVRTDSGTVLPFATMADNRSNDSIWIPARIVAGGR